MLKNRILNHTITISLAVMIAAMLLKAMLYINKNAELAVKVDDLLCRDLSLWLLCIIVITALIHFGCRIYRICTSCCRNTTRKKVAVICVSVLCFIAIGAFCFVSSVITVFTENTVKEYTVCDTASGKQYYVTVEQNFLDGGDPMYVTYYEYVNSFLHKTTPVTNFKCHIGENPLSVNKNFIPTPSQIGKLLTVNGSIIGDQGTI